jgi:ABC-type glutathione transport system ATPase component
MLVCDNTRKREAVPTALVEWAHDVQPSRRKHANALKLSPTPPALTRSKDLPMPGEPLPAQAVTLEGVSRSFGSVHAVEDVDLQLPLGEIAALLGPNGAGKTTTIDMILGLGRPDRGTVKVLGMKPSTAI